MQPSRGKRTGLSFSLGHSDSVRNGARQTSELASRLAAWWSTQSVVRPLPAPLDTLSTPVVRAVTCAVPGALWNPGKLFNELLATAWIAALVAMLCGLPFHLMAYLASPAHSGFGLPTLEFPRAQGGSSSWPVRFLFLIPALRYHDKPILVAQTAVKSRGTFPSSLDPSSPDPSSPRKATREPVSVAKRHPRSM
jgi:hypothetical protein